MIYKFNKELYSKVALMKAAYNYTDRAFLHLDSDDKFFYVDITMKDESNSFSEKDFLNEMLAQSVRHEVYIQTKNIRELMLARAMSTSLVADMESSDIEQIDDYSEDEILHDWFNENE